MKFNSGVAGLIIVLLLIFTWSMWGQIINQSANDARYFGMLISLAAMAILGILAYFWIKRP